MELRKRDKAEVCLSCEEKLENLVTEDSKTMVKLRLKSVVTMEIGKIQDQFRAELGLRVAFKVT